MFRADLLEEVGVHPALNVLHRISAQNVHVVCPDKLVTELFHLDCCLCVTLCPQEMHTFSEDCNARMFPICSLYCRHNEIAKRLHKPNSINHALDYECREGVCSIQRDVSTLLNGHTDVHALSLQSWKKAVPV